MTQLPCFLFLVVAIWTLVIVNGLSVGTEKNPGRALVEFSLPRVNAVASSETAQFPTEYSIDGDKSTRWQSDSHDTEWIYVDMGDTYSVTQVVLHWTPVQSPGRTFAIETSTDASVWEFQEKVSESLLKTVAVDLPLGPNARYVRIRGEKRGSRLGYSLREIEMTGRDSTLGSSSTPAPTASTPSVTPPVSTVTQGGSPTNMRSPLPLVRAVASSEISILPASNAIDQMRNTRWQSFASDEEWIYVDLGAIYLISRVILIWTPVQGTGRTFTIDTSSDLNTPWKTERWFVNNKAKTQFILFSTPVKARYVRMKGIARGGRKGYSLREFSIQGDINSKVVSSGLSMLPRVASAASTESISGPAANAVDGIVTTRWQSKLGDSQWIYVDMGAAYSVTRVILHWTPVTGPARTYDIETSNDTVTWTPQQSMVKTSSNIEVIDFATAVMARYVRMKGLDGGGASRYSMREFEIFGYDNIAATPSPAPTTVISPPTPIPTTMSTPGSNQPGTSSLTIVSATASSQMQQFPVENAFDKSKQTRWQSKPNDNEWIILDLGIVNAVNRLVLYWTAASSPGRSYDVQTSIGGQFWAQQRSIVNSMSKSEEIILNTGTRARFVAVRGVKRSTASGYALREVKVFGELDGTIQDTTLSPTISPVSTMNPTSSLAPSMSSTSAPTGEIVSPHSIKLHWQSDYRWQGKPHERKYCIVWWNERIQIQRCKNPNITQWEFVFSSDMDNMEGDMIRMAGTDECIGVRRNNDFGVDMYKCNASVSKQRFVPGDGFGSFKRHKFDIRPVDQKMNCLSQQHHPKSDEYIRVMSCEIAHNHTTGFWVKYEDQFN